MAGMDDQSDDARFAKNEYDPVDAEFSHLLVRARMADIYTDACLDELANPQAATAHHISSLWRSGKDGKNMPPPEWRAWVRLEQRLADAAKRARYGQGPNPDLKPLKDVV